MTTATRVFCRTVFQVTRKGPLKRKRQQPWRVPAQPLEARPFSSTPWRADERTRDQIAPAKTSQPSPSEDSNRDTTSKAEGDEVGHIDFATLDVSDLMVPSSPITLQDLSPEARADYEVLPKDQQPKYLALENHYRALTESPELEQEFHQLARQVAREVDKRENINFPNIKLRNSEVGFWADEEDDEFGRVEDDDDEVSEEHITSVAESELELHREMRDYTRIAAWEMPLLGSMFLSECEL
jgi:hypothetical protein